MLIKFSLLWLTGSELLLSGCCGNWHCPYTKQLEDIIYLLFKIKFSLC